MIKTQPGHGPVSDAYLTQNEENPPIDLGGVRGHTDTHTDRQTDTQTEDLPALII